MSDPMTNMEIEDVLSSIRRLVSEDHRLPPRVAPKVDLPADKLVLTPALRIVAETRPTVPAPEIVAAEASSDPTPSHKAAAAVMEAALSASTEDWEPDGSEVSRAPDWAVEWEAGPAPEKAETTGVVASESSMDEPLDWAKTVSEAVDEPSPEVVPAQVLAEEPEPEEPVIIDQSTAEPVVAEPVDHAAEDEFLADTDFDPLIDLDDLSDSLVDEEAIRDLVREILREELQGALGERITRNVRKLVRAEINLALAARELD